MSGWPLERAVPEHVGLDARRLQTVDRLMAAWIAEGRIAGGVTLVARHGRIAHLGVQGWADLARRTPLRDDTLFRIYSMTKPITCAATLMLYEEGRFLLDDPVRSYLSECAEFRVRVKGADGADELVRPKRDVTIHDLLTHLGGLTYECALQARKEGWTLAEFLRRFVQVPLAHHPGERWLYSASHDVLGRLIEVLSGRPLDAFLEERVFRPLGMTDTFFHVPAEKRDRLATLYTEDAEGRLTSEVDPWFAFEAPPPGQPCFFSGGGGLVSTAGDYLRFCLMLLNNGAWNGVRLLGRKTVELMTADHLPPDHPPIEPFKFGYGLGVSVLRSLGEKQGLGSIGEFGWGGAASTEAWVDPREDLVSIILLQLRPARPHSFTKLFKHAVYQAIAD